MTPGQDYEAAGILVVLSVTREPVAQACCPSTVA